MQNLLAGVMTLASLAVCGMASSVLSGYRADSFFSFIVFGNFNVKLYTIAETLGTAVLPMGLAVVIALAICGVGRNFRKFFWYFSIPFFILSLLTSWMAWYGNMG